METTQNHDQKKLRAIGGNIPEELYWAFKSTLAARHETTTKALEIAIRLYLDAVPKENN